MLVAAAALIWAIWLTRNEVIFEKARPKTSCRYYLGAHIGYTSGPACSVRMSTRSCWFKRVDTYKYLLYSSLVLGAGYLVDGLVQFDLFYRFLFVNLLVNRSDLQIFRGAVS